MIQWLIQSTAAHARLIEGGGKPGLVRPEMLAGKLPFPHIADTFDFLLIEVSPGKAVFQGTPQLMHYNPLSSVHGGCYATLLDSAVGCAVHNHDASGSWVYNG